MALSYAPAPASASPVVQVNELAARVDRLSRRLSQIAIREGITPLYDRTLVVYFSEKGRLDRLRTAADEAPLW